MVIETGELRRALEETGQRHGPGLFGLVTERGEVVFEGSTGVADLTRPRPIDAGDRFRIASVTKTFVAVVVLQLVASGTLTPGDSVQRWLPGAVPDGDGITVDLLLRMRSGLPDYTDALLGDPPDLSVLRRYWAPEELVRVGVGAPDRMPPGAAYRYSNTDYVLLGLIVERATGQRFDAQLWQRVLEPLGLTDTTFPTVDPYLRGPHALGYLRVSDSVPYQEFTVLSPSETYTAGAMVSTAGDLARFLDGLFGGLLLDGDGLARMTDCAEPLDGYRTRGLAIIRYDFGRRQRGVRVPGRGTGVHDGGAAYHQRQVRCPLAERHRRTSLAVLGRPVHPRRGRRLTGPLPAPSGSRRDAAPGRTCLGDLAHLRDGAGQMPSRSTVSCYGSSNAST